MYRIDLNLIFVIFKELNFRGFRGIALNFQAA